jgi:periplasmic protein TonB
MRILISLFFSVCLSFALYGQSKIFYDSFDYQTDSLTASYYTITTKDSLQEGALSKSYYLSGNIKSIEHYSSLNPQTKDGSFITFYENGQKMSESNFVKGLQHGKELRWYDNGQLKLERNYEESCLEGSFTSYHKNGHLKRKELYKNNEFIEGQCYNSMGKDTTYFPFLVETSFPGGVKVLQKYIVTTMRKEVWDYVSDRAIKGKVTILFIVSKNGEIINSRIIKSLNSICDTEALRIINSMPNWSPAIEDGEPIERKVTIPFVFRKK